MSSAFTYAAILATAFAFGLPGLLLLDRPADEASGYRLALDDAFAVLAFGLGLLGWLALLLAELSLFRPALLVGGALILPGMALFAARRRLRRLRLAPPASRRAWWLLLWLPVAGWLFFRPHQYIHGGADAGVYVNIAAQLVQQGGLLVPEPLLAALPADAAELLLRPLPDDFGRQYLFPGFYVPDAAATLIEPQFYHLHPAWQGVALAFGGMPAALGMTGLWALLGSIAVALTARQVGGGRVAVLVLIALTLNALQIWFARYPTTEMLAQFLLWTALWSIGCWLSARRPGRFWALLAALMLGSALLVRIDLLFLFAVAPLIFLWRRWRGEARRGDLWFYIPFAFLAAHAFIHARLFTLAYFNNTFGLGVAFALRFWPLPAAGLALFGGAAFWLGRRRESAGGAMGTIIPRLAVVTLLLLAAYAAVVRPNLGEAASRFNWYDGRTIPRVDAQNVPRLNGYLSPLGYLLATLGAALLLARPNRRTVAVSGVGLFFALLYLWRIQANPQQIYSMRRYVPAVMPFMLVATAFFLDWLGQRPWRYARGAALLLAIAWLGSLGWLARGFVSRVDFPGLPGQVAALAAPLPPDAVLLFNDTAPVGQGDFLGTPLRFIHGRSTFVLRAPAEPLAAELETVLLHWQATGRDIYWVAVPGGQPWPLPDWTTSPLTQYRIVTTVLEAPEARRPTEVLDIEWTGTIYHILPP